MLCFYTSADNILTDKNKTQKVRNVTKMAINETSQFSRTPFKDERQFQIWNKYIAWTYKYFVQFGKPSNFPLTKSKSESNHGIKGQHIAVIR